MIIEEKLKKIFFSDLNLIVMPMWGIYWIIITMTSSWHWYFYLHMLSTYWYCRHVLGTMCAHCDNYWVRCCSLIRPCFMDTFKSLVWLPFKIVLSIDNSCLSQPWIDFYNSLNNQGILTQKQDNWQKRI